MIDQQTGLLQVARDSHELVIVQADGDGLSAWQTVDGPW